MKIDFQSEENQNLKLESYYVYMYGIAKKFLDKFRNDEIEKSDFEQEKLWKTYQNLSREKENYLSFLRAKLDKVLYEDLTLEEVRILYKGKGGKPSNDQNETGNA